MPIKAISWRFGWDNDPEILRYLGCGTRCTEQMVPPLMMWRWQVMALALMMLPLMERQALALLLVLLLLERQALALQLVI